MVRELGGDKKPFSHVAFSPDGLLLVAGGRGNYLQVWEVASGRLIQRFECVETLAAQFSPDGTLLIHAGVNGRAVVTALGAVQRHPELTYEGAGGGGGSMLGQAPCWCRLLIARSPKDTGRARSISPAYVSAA
jgi:hypothetical protein